MIDLLTGAGMLGGVAGLGWWLRHDGPVRLCAGIVAVCHPDKTRRRDARAVLTCTGHTARDAEVVEAEVIRRKPGRSR